MTTRKTRTIETSINPVWNEVRSCPLALRLSCSRATTCRHSDVPQSLLGFKWNGVDVLQVRVFDRDTLSLDADHGVAWVRYGGLLTWLCVCVERCRHVVGVSVCRSLEGLPEGLEQTVTAPLRGNVQGTVTLELTLQRHE
jgi:hypothetical protein